MAVERINQWVQILTGIALLIGLILVVIEMRQGLLIASAQLTQAGFFEFQDMKRQRMGENPAPTLTKACLHPEQLTDDEITVAVVDSNYRYDTIAMTMALSEIAGTPEAWRDMAEYQLKAMFATKLGRIEFHKHRHDPRRWHPEVAAMALEILQSGDFIRCEDLYRDWKKGLAEAEPEL